MWNKQQNDIQKTGFLKLFVLICSLMFLSASLSNAQKKEAAEYIDNLVSRNKLPGIQYIIFNTDSVIFEYNAGMRDLSKKSEVTSNTVFKAYSITKTFTAMAILQLVEKGQLSLNDSLRQFINDYPYRHEITIRQLLSHTSGLANPIPATWVHVVEEHDQFDEDAFIRQQLNKHDRLKYKPGKKKRYSNFDYLLLGMIIEKVSGEKYEEYIRRNILQKLDIPRKHLDFIIHDDSLYATGYQNKYQLIQLTYGILGDRDKFMRSSIGKWIPFNNFYLNGNAYGGLIGTARGLTVWGQHLLSRDSTLLSSRMKELYFTPVRLNNGKKTNQCLSWFERETNYTRYYAHPGGAPGYASEIRLYPEHNIGSVYLMNRTFKINHTKLLSDLNKHFINDTTLLEEDDKLKESLKE